MTKKPTILDYLDRFKQYHAKNLAWGSLHIVLDDDNVQDDSVRHCIKLAKETGDTEGEALGEILLSMSKTQRSKLGKIV